MVKTIHSKGQEALCAKLILTRLERGLSQADLAARLSCHQSMVARIESGQRRIDVVELVVLARALEIDPKNVLEVVDLATPACQKF
ncbi:helix-turn-helix domain-containing protein [Halovulum sp. GXIMD14793]